MILAGFADEAAMRRAQARLAPFGLVETHSPAPPEGDEGSPLPLIVLVAGVLGAGGAFAVQAYANAVSYPMNIGGRPPVLWPSFIPSAFETGVLCAMLAGFVGFFVLCRLPMLYAPIDEAEVFRRASRDLWFLVLRPEPGVVGPVRAALAGCGPVLSEEVPG